MIASGVNAMNRQLTIRTPGQGLHEFTDQIEAVIVESGVADGLCTVFVQHTSASLTIQENADPSARFDLERWLNHLVRENDPQYTHTSEGPDDMPSHIKSALTATTLSIPIVEGRLALGTWQGIYLWEHRRAPHPRRIIVHISS
jgi:secondary thiamine-phosphate synthase enzyme